MFFKRRETTTKRYCLSGFIDRCILTFEYNLIEEPKVNDIKNALNLLKFSSHE